MLTKYEQILSESALVSVDSAMAICHLSDLREAIEKVYTELYEPGDGDKIRELLSKIGEEIVSASERAEKINRAALDMDKVSK